MTRLIEGTPAREIFTVKLTQIARLNYFRGQRGKPAPIPSHARLARHLR